MLIKEYRVVLPFTTEEYHIAQLYMVAKVSRQETGNGEGITVLENKPYEDEDGTKGQYTNKIMHLANRVPRWMKPILPKSALKLEEEAWNAYPYCKTQYVCPFFGGKFSMSVLTMHVDNDRGEQENVHKLDDDVLKKREVDVIDIANDVCPKSAYVEEEDPKLFKSELTGRGPLGEKWRETATPIMCAYKLCSVEFKYWGLQGKIERTIHKSGFRDVFFKSHRQAYCWSDEWSNMTMEDLRAYEEETKAVLDARIADPNATVATGAVDDDDDEKEKKEKK